MFILILIMQRKFVRACSDEKEVKHSIFRQWLGESEEMWVDIIAEDEAFDYSANVCTEHGSDCST